jgi:hypothetical protein
MKWAFEFSGNALSYGRVSGWMGEHFKCSTEYSTASPKPMAH